jgi:pyridoxal phosphate enzyme (YggS family)
VSPIRENLRSTRARIARACAVAGRSVDDVLLVAVTKSVGVAEMVELHELGVRDFGENRPQELVARRALFESSVALRGGDPSDVRWHFIGHLQRNKARRVARLADEVHAVDTAALLATLARIADEDGASPALYLQVKLTDEDAKHGLAPADVPVLVAEARARGQRLAGLMTMAPLEGGQDAARPVFERLARLAAELDAAAFEGGRPRLSMGMSGDLEVAVAAGADDVRIGTALFEGLDGAEEAA